MKQSLIAFGGACLMSAAVEAEVRVFVQNTGGVAWIKYECTGGEVIRSFALDVAVDRGQITGISDFFTGTCSALARGYGIFPSAFRDHITVSSGTSANWSVTGYNPLAVVADSPSDTLGGLGTGGVTLELGALWDPALPATAPASSGNLCALHLSQGAHVRVAANASRGGVVASPDGNVVAPIWAGAAVGPLPEIVVEQPSGTNLADGGSRDCGAVAIGSNNSLGFTIRNTGSADLTGLAITKDGSNPDDFTITSTPVSPVGGPNGSTTFTVRFTPAATGSRGAVIHIANNDGDENPFDISLTGIGVAVPEIVVEQPSGTNLADGGSRDCGAVAIGSNRSIGFIIRNTGSADLTGLAITKDGSNPDDFTVTSTPVSPVGGPNGSTTFTVRFTPTAAGSRGAVIHIANNDGDENPFDIGLSGSGITGLQEWMSAAGVPPDQAGPQQTPQGDGVPNLLKFAFNMDPTKPDARTLTVGADGTAGLPGGARIGGVFRLEFLRRKAATHPGITYTPQFGSGPDLWTDFTGTESVSPLNPENPTWERVVAEDPAPGQSQRFGRLKIMQTP